MSVNLSRQGVIWSGGEKMKAEWCAEMTKKGMDENRITYIIYQTGPTWTRGRALVAIFRGEVSD